MKFLDQYGFPDLNRKKAEHRNRLILTPITASPTGMWGRGDIQTALPTWIYGNLTRHLSWWVFAWGRQKARKINGEQRWNSCTSQNMNYGNAHRTRDYTKPALGLYLLQFINGALICVWAVTLQLSVAAFSLKAAILFFFCVTRISSLKQPLLQVRIERLAHTKQERGGGERDGGKVTFCPYLASSDITAMLIKEPVNAEAHETENRYETRTKTPSYSLSSPSASLTLNYNYWALAPLCSSCQMWDSGVPYLMSHLCFSTPNLRAHTQCFWSFPHRSFFHRLLFLPIPHESIRLTFYWDSRATDSEEQNVQHKPKEQKTDLCNRNMSEGA